jgi:hypothetical protein
VGRSISVSCLIGYELDSDFDVIHLETVYETVGTISLFGKRRAVVKLSKPLHVSSLYLCGIV